MPEQITKHPDVTMQVLKGAGARCGEGVQPKILTKCPPEKFCSLRTGEMCIYGISDIPKMTQIKTSELAEVVCPRPAAEAGLISQTVESALLMAAIFVAGVVLGRSRRSLAMSPRHS